jgi:methylmalonyl-CoA/ethylmalonyl-CoA epimerase
MSGFEVDHIGIAVKSLQEGFLFYQALGFTSMDIEEVPDQKVKVGFLQLDNQMNIELLESTDEKGPIAKFLQKRGPGLHHVCLRVPELSSILKRLKDQGVRLIDQEPRRGAHNCWVAFVHPESTGGVLIELSQPIRSETSNLGIRETL